MMDIDDFIPAEHYQAVARIISYVFQLKGRLKPSDLFKNKKPTFCKAGELNREVKYTNMCI